MENYVEYSKISLLTLANLKKLKIHLHLSEPSEIFLLDFLKSKVHTDYVVEYTELYEEKP